MVVDGGVDVVEAQTGTAGAAGLAAQDLVSAAVGDPAELLDVDVDEFAGPVAFVAADDLAGGPVQVGQPVQAVADQNAVHGRGGQAQDRADAGRAEFAGLPQPADLGLQGRRSAVWCRSGAAGAVGKARIALNSPPVNPLVGRGS